MKNIIYLLAFISLSVSAQSKYLTKTGVIDFEASVPSFEEVKAKNNGITAIINTETGEFASLALIKGFRFKNALMEEHFNENYAESSLYPKATFKGKIIDFSFDKLTEDSKSFKVRGELTFHGKTVIMDNVPLDMSLINDEIIMSGSFKTEASAFDIKIPKIVRNKIAEDVEVTFYFKLKKK